MTEAIRNIYFNSTGRLSRWQYLKYQLLLWAVLAVWGEITSSPNVDLFLSILPIYPRYCLDVQRLHDLGRSNKLALLNLVLICIAAVMFFFCFIDLKNGGDGLIMFPMLLPLAGIALIMNYLLFRRGNYGPNAYGPDPLE